MKKAINRQQQTTANQILNTSLKNFEEIPLFIQGGFFFYKKFEQVRRQPFFLKFIACQVLKKKGNDFFRKKDYWSSVINYEQVGCLLLYLFFQALSIFRYIKHDIDEQELDQISLKQLEYITDYQKQQRNQQKIFKILLQLYLNLAACYLKVKDNKNALAACNEALIIEPLNIKALYRRSKCRSNDISAGSEEFKLALKDLKLAYEIAPQENSVVQELLKIKREFLKMKEIEKKYLQRMFSPVNSKPKNLINVFNITNEQQVKVQLKNPQKQQSPPNSNSKEKATSNKKHKRKKKKKPAPDPPDQREKEKENKPKMVYATCENNPKRKENYTIKHERFELNFKNPQEIADIMGQNLFKNIADEFLDSDAQQDYGLEVTLFDSDIFMDETMDFLENFTHRNITSKNKENQKA